MKIEFNLLLKLFVFLRLSDFGILWLSQLHVRQNIWKKKLNELIMWRNDVHDPQ